MNLLVLENDTIQCEKIQNAITQNFPYFSCQYCKCYSDAQAALSIQNYNAFILNITLSDNHEIPDAIRFGHYIRNNAKKYRTIPILFTADTFDNIIPCLNELHCYTYFTKPYHTDALIDALKTILNQNTIEPAYGYITIKLLNSVDMRIPFSDITHIEAVGHQLCIYSFNQTFPTTSFSLNAIQSMLPNYFIQCHRKFLINKNYISMYDKTNQYINISSYTIPVGRTYKKLLEMHINE